MTYPDNGDAVVFDSIRDSVMVERDAFPRNPLDADSGDVAESVLTNLVRLAMDEGHEGALRWLDRDGSRQARIEEARL